MSQKYNTILSNYLQDTKTQFDSNLLSDRQKILLIEFFIKSQLLKSSNPIDDNNCLKYLFMGYYVYEILLGKSLT